MAEEPDLLLRKLSARFGGKPSDCLHYDANVCTSESDPAAPWKLMPVEGTPFSLRSSLVYRGKRLGLMANREYLQISVKGAFPWKPFTINMEERIGFASKLTVFRVGTHRVFTADGEVSSVQAKLLRKPRLVQLINALNLRPGESLHFFTNAITLYLIRPVESRAAAAIDGLITLTEGAEDSQVEELDSSKLPERFRHFLPLIKQWAKDDDLEREELVRGSSKAELKLLVKQVGPDLEAVDSYLDSFGALALSPEAAALGRLAECVLEAKQYLETEVAENT